MCHYICIFQVEQEEGQLCKIKAKEGPNPRDDFTTQITILVPPSVFSLFWSPEQLYFQPYRLPTQTQSSTFVTLSARTHRSWVCPVSTQVIASSEGYRADQRHQLVHLSSLISFLRLSSGMAWNMQFTTDDLGKDMRNIEECCHAFCFPLVPGLADGTYIDLQVHPTSISMRHREYHSILYCVVPIPARMPASTQSPASRATSCKKVSKVVSWNIINAFFYASYTWPVSSYGSPTNRWFVSHITLPPQPNGTFPMDDLPWSYVLLKKCIQPMGWLIYVWSLAEWYLALRLNRCPLMERYTLTATLPV